MQRWYRAATLGRILDAMETILNALACRVVGHAWVPDNRLRLVVLRDDPMLEYVDGLPHGAGTRCTRCDRLGVA